MNVSKPIVALLGSLIVGGVVLGIGPRIGGEPESRLTPTQLEIDFFSERVAANPADVISATRLGTALRQNQRETGDLSSLRGAETVLSKALDALPTFEPAQLALARVLIDLHRFEEGLELALAIRDPDLLQEAALAAGDALLATGAVADAERMFRGLPDVSESPAVLARLARIAELTGDRAGAIEMMMTANMVVAAEHGVGEQAAWYATRLGDLYLVAGMVDAAEDEFVRALTSLPRYAPAVASLGEVSIARGDYESAIAHFETAASLATDPDWLFTLARLHELIDDQHGARRYEQAALETIDEYGSIHPRDFAIHYAATGETDLALAYGEAAYAQSQDVYAHDVMAWVLYRAGRLEEAKEHAEAALALGTNEADFFYHHGAILIALGESELGLRQLSQALDLGLAPWDAELARKMIPRQASG